METVLGARSIGMSIAIAGVVVGCRYQPAPATVDDGAPNGDAAITSDDGPGDGPTQPPAELHLYVEAKIDGRSNLIIQGTDVTWEHFQFAAPGRETFTNLPTMLDLVEWQPIWPDVPDAENRDCNCMSSTYTELPVALPGVPSTVTVTHVKGRRTTTPSVLVQPTSENGYTLVLEFTDVGLSGSDIYGADVAVVPL